MVAREVLINIFPGIRREIKLTARICESFVTPAALPIVPSHVAFEISLLVLALAGCESQFFSGFTALVILGVTISMVLRGDLNLRDGFPRIKMVKVIYIYIYIKKKKKIQYIWLKFGLCLIILRAFLFGYFVIRSSRNNGRRKTLNVYSRRL